ncbi:arachidonate 5-lipoxygenase-like, partial [Paramuricea clavata]
MVVTKILSDRGTNPLGNFEVQYMYDPIGIEAIERFKKRLGEVAQIIDERNKSREFPYPYLHPLE